VTPPAFLLQPEVGAVLRALPGARAVGGAVRDHLAGRPIHDVDVAAPFPPEEIGARLKEAGLKVFETGLAHGTLTAVLAGRPVEVTALRRDVATDGRHAEVEWTTDWAEDAARRDFTINAMSMEPDGTLHDLFGGVADLRAGRVRFVGDAATRLREDYLRALRFFRFQARYGVGEPDPAAVSAIAEAVPGLGRLSAERVWAEIKRILEAPDPVASLRLMDSTGVLPAVLPEGAEIDALARLVAAGAGDAVLRFGALLRRDAPLAPVANRLKLSGAERDRLLEMRQAGPPAGLGGGELLWLVADAGRDAMTDRAWIAEARDGDDRAALRGRIVSLPVPAFPLGGQDALEAGLTGPRIGAVLAELRRGFYREGGTASRQECLHRLRELAKAAPG
jgi:poly(A) polymerase/tRNA nucleotidyltransferase (CCA-adding enzyme)